MIEIGPNLKDALIALAGCVGLIALCWPETIRIRVKPPVHSPPEKPVLKTPRDRP